MYYDRGTVEVRGRVFTRLAVQTHFVTPGESYLDLLTRYVLPLCRAGDIVASAEKVVAMCQGNIVSRDEVRVGFLARNLSRFATSTSHGIGMDEPLKLQLAIDLAGTPRILLATLLSAVTKPFGKRGVFYRVAGHGIAGIDGFYQDSAFPFYKDHAILNPLDPVGLCNEVYAKLGLRLAIFDANDLNVELFGKCESLRELDDEFLKDLVRDNPAGQSDELTPFIIIREEPAIQRAMPPRQRRRGPMHMMASESRPAPHSGRLEGVTGAGSVVRPMR